MTLMLPSTLCLVVLILHSLYYRPLRATKLFLLFAVPMAASYGGADSYVFNVPTLMIPGPGPFKIPVAHVIGFTFAFYCAMNLSVHLFETKKNGRRTVPYFTLLCSTVFLTSFIGLAIEYANKSIGWWSWKIPIDPIMIWTAWGWRPLVIFPIFYRFFVPKKEGSKKGMAKTISVMIVFLIIVILTLNIFVFLRFFVVAIWPVLLILTRIKRPEVVLDLLQYDKAVPLRSAQRKYIAAAASLVD